MLRTIVFVSFLVTCLGTNIRRFTPRIDGRVVGGKPVTIEEYPYQLAFLYHGSHSCGAVIIKENYALTAAHCADGASPSAVSFRAGSSLHGAGGSLHTAEKVIIHEQYDYFTIDYDVSVVRVAQAFPLESPGVAAVPLPVATPSLGSTATVSGWGLLTESGNTPDALQAVEVQVMDRDECSESYAMLGAVTARMLCAGLPDGGKDACIGDSGGPLVVAGQLAGLVSWGYGCARPGYPGVYTDVASVRDWVIRHASSADPRR